MGQTIQSKEFRWMTKGLRTAFTIIMVMMIFALTMLAIFMVGAMVVSEQQVNHLLAKGSVTAAVQLEGLEMKLADHVTSDIHYSKRCHDLPIYCYNIHSYFTVYYCTSKEYFK